MTERWTVIHSYTRAEALEDGVLVDVTEWAGPKGMMGGFSCPVALTSAVWSAIESIPKRLEGIADVRGRAHDVLWMAACAVRRARSSSQARFRVILPRQGERTRNVDLLVAIGPGDAGEPVVTIGFPSDF